MKAAYNARLWNSLVAIILIDASSQRIPYTSKLVMRVSSVLGLNDIKLNGQVGRDGLRRSLAEGMRRLLG
jgi:hypothetical protein